MSVFWGTLITNFKKFELLANCLVKSDEEFFPCGILRFRCTEEGENLWNDSIPWRQTSFLFVLVFRIQFVCFGTDHHSNGVSSLIKGFGYNKYPKDWEKLEEEEKGNYEKEGKAMLSERKEKRKSDEKPEWEQTLQKLIIKRMMEVEGLEDDVDTEIAMSPPPPLPLALPLPLDDLILGLRGSVKGLVPSTNKFATGGNQRARDPVCVVWGGV
jgi:hypothetical protein